MKNFLARLRTWRWQMAQWAEWRWWRRYLRDKNPGEYLLAKALYWNRFLDQCAIDLPENAAVLDAGCGPAGIFIVCSRQRVTAVDPLLPRYMRHLPDFRPDAYPWVHFVASPLEILSWEPQFDRIFCLNAINHTRDPGEVLRRLNAAMRPGAKLVMSTDTHKYRLLRLIFKAIPGDILHPQQMDQEDYQRLLVSNGFRVINRFVAKKGRIFDYTVFVTEAG